MILDIYISRSIIKVLNLSICKADCQIAIQSESTSSEPVSLTFRFTGYQIRHCTVACILLHPLPASPRLHLASIDETAEPGSENGEYYIVFTNIADNTTSEDVKKFLLTAIPENLHQELKRVEVVRSRKDGRALNGWVLLSSRNVFDMAMDQFRKHKLKGKLVEFTADLDDPFNIPNLTLPMDPQGQASNAQGPPLSLAQTWKEEKVIIADGTTQRPAVPVNKEERPPNTPLVVDGSIYRHEPGPEGWMAVFKNYSLQPSPGPNADAANLTAADELPPPKAEDADPRPRNKNLTSKERRAKKALAKGAVAAKAGGSQAGPSSGTGTGGGPSSSTGKKEEPQQTKKVVGGSSSRHQSKSEGKKPAR